jgi:hypothetical protein
MTPAIPVALWAAFAGHLLVLIAAVTDSVPPNMAIVAAIACSIIAVAALTELAPPEVRVRRQTPLRWRGLPPGRLRHGKDAIRSGIW